MQSGTETDIKKAQQTVKSLNLGFVAIDQIEEIEKPVFEAVDASMRRDVPFGQFMATANPANFWGWDFFKANPNPFSNLIEGSMYDNKNHLPEGYIEAQLQKSKGWVERYVFGKWDPGSLDEGSVFEQEHIDTQLMMVKEPIRETQGIKIYEEPERDYSYQIGIDPSEGAVDPCYISVVCKETGRQVASFGGFVPISLIPEKILAVDKLYSTRKRRTMIVPEANAAGVAVVEKLKENPELNIYEREVPNRREKIITTKLGWRTDRANKKWLIDEFYSLLDKKFVKISDRGVVNEMMTFEWSDEVRRQGAGAKKGFHDDKVMATMLAYHDLKPVTPREKSLIKRLKEKEDKVHQYQWL